MFNAAINTAMVKELNSTANNTVEAQLLLPTAIIKRDQGSILSFINPAMDEVSTITVLTAISILNFTLDEVLIQTAAMNQSIV